MILQVLVGRLCYCPRALVLNYCKQNQLPGVASHWFWFSHLTLNKKENKCISIPNINKPIWYAAYEVLHGIIFLLFYVYVCVDARSRQRSTCSGWGGRRGATGWCHLLRRAVRWTHPSSGAVTRPRPPPLGLNVTEDCFCARHHLLVRTTHRFSSLYAFTPYSITNHQPDFRWTFPRGTILKHFTYIFLGQINFICISHWTLWQQL